jgi:hypothetical protein
MDVLQPTVVATGLFFLFVLLSGIWLSRTGRPLNVVISTIHKLISLATGVYLIVTIYQENKVAPLGRAEWSAIVVTGLCFLALVATGGLLSTDKQMPTAVLRVHQIVPVLTVFSAAAILYLLLSRV